MTKINKKSIVLIVALLLVAIGITGFYFLSGSQYFSIDVNPSIEIKTNRLDKVVNIKPLNPEAKALLAGYRSSGAKLDDVVADLVDRMILQDYIGSDKNSDILITVRDNTASQKTLDKVNDSIADYLTERQVSASIHTQKLNWDNETEKLAEDAGISPGKMSIVEQVSGSSGMAPDELAKMGISDIFDVAQSSDIVLENIDKKESTPQQNTTAVDEAGARAVFESHYPGITIEKIQLQDGGSSYYIFAEADGVYYKMKVLSEDGRIVYNYSGDDGTEIQDFENPTDTNEDNTVNSNNDSSGATESNTEYVGSVDEARAREIFENHYPGVTIKTIKLQDDGSVYYMYGEAKGTHYKMKVRVSDGEVVYNYAGGNGNNNQNQQSETPASTEESSVPSSSGGSINEAGAKEIFASYYPGVSVSTIKLQDNGSIYYMYGESGNNHYKMKVRVSDGEVVYNYASGNGNNNQNQQDKIPASTEESSVPSSSSGGSVTEAGAKEIFASYYPGVSVSTIKLQDNGTIYYMYGESGNNHYKMKVSVSDGSVVYNYSGTSGNQGNNGGGNQSGRSNGRGSNNYRGR